MKFVEDKLIVFEGLDNTGKSTTMQGVKDELIRMGVDPLPLFTHQPSGGSTVGQAVYNITEKYDIASGLARQFLHLASHAEHYKRDILPALEHGSVFMDRCWWSTYAYGYDHLIEVFKSGASLINLIQAPTQGKLPDLVFFFSKPFGEDKFNTPHVTDKYWDLAESYADKTMVMPNLDLEQRVAFVLQLLIQFNYLVEGN